MPRKGEAITLSCTPDEKAGLEIIALRLGYKWGDKPNVSALIGAIGRGELKVEPEIDVKARLEALKRTPEVQEFLRLKNRNKE